MQIGEKGIGFKSVSWCRTILRFTQTGSVFASTGSKYGTLGLVIPEWLGLEDVQQPIGTRIVVTLRESRSWRLEPKHLRPELLVFLQRLCHLSVTDHINGWSVESSHSESPRPR